MASTSTKAVGTTKSILELVTTLEGHEEEIRSISYFPNGQRMISGSLDYTTRQWDLKAGKEIEEAQEFYEEHVHAVAVSRDGRWVVTGGGSYDSSELNACEVETGIVKTFGSHSHHISCIDISADATLLASGAMDCTTLIWNLDTGKLVAGPFEAVDSVGAVRFSTDSKKLAVKSWTGGCLDVWDIKTQMLDVRVGRRLGVRPTHAPVFWAKEGATIIAAFTFGDVGGTARTIYEFDASTLETVGAPFEGHTKHVNYLALSSDGALLASVAQDNTLKLWACESRQLLASFYVQNPRIIVLSPDSRQLVYATNTEDDHNIYICNTPPDVLQAQALTNARKKSTLSDLLNSDATRRVPAERRRQPIFVTPTPQRPPPTIDPQQSVFVRLRKLLQSSSRTNTIPHIQVRDPLDVPATLPLPSSLSGQAAPRFDHFEISSPPPPSIGVTQFLRQHLSFLAPRHSLGPPVVEVAPGRKVTRLVAVKLPEYKKVDDTRHPFSQQATAVPQENDSSDIDSLPDVHWCKAFLCYYSCWSHGRLRMPPRWRLERVDIPRQDGTANSSRGDSHGRT